MKSYLSEGWFRRVEFYVSKRNKVVGIQWDCINMRARLREETVAISRRHLVVTGQSCSSS